jgi:hypothetical protein
MSDLLLRNRSWCDFEVVHNGSVKITVVEVAIGLIPRVHAREGEARVVKEERSEPHIYKSRRTHLNCIVSNGTRGDRAKTDDFRHGAIEKTDNGTDESALTKLCSPCADKDHMI